MLSMSFTAHVVLIIIIVNILGNIWGPIHIAQALTELKYYFIKCLPFWNVHTAYPKLKDYSP